MSLDVWLADAEGFKRGELHAPGRADALDQLRVDAAANGQTVAVIGVDPEPPERASSGMAEAKAAYAAATTTDERVLVIASRIGLV